MLPLLKRCHQSSLSYSRSCRLLQVHGRKCHGKNKDTETHTEEKPPEKVQSPSTLISSFKSGRRRLSPSQRLGTLISEDYWKTQDVSIQESVNLVQGELTKALESAKNQTQDPEVEVHAKPFTAGESILISVQKAGGKMYQKIIMLREKKDFALASFGEIDLEDIFGKSPGYKLSTSKQYEATLTRPTLEEFMDVSQKATQTLRPKIAMRLLSHCGLSSGDRVLEAGAGSGHMTMLLSTFVGEQGYVDSYELRSKHLKTASCSLELCRTVLGGDRTADNVTLHHRAVGANSEDTEAEEGINTNYDFVFLDVPCLTYVMESVVNALKPGKTLCFVTPSVSRIMTALSFIENNDVSLSVEKVIEFTDITWSTHPVTCKMISPNHNEYGTVFAAIFRCYVKDDLSTGPNSTDTKKSNGILNYGDTVIVRTIYIPKKAKPVIKAVELQEGGYLNTSWGSVPHSEMEGKISGSVVQTSMNNNMMVYRAGMGDNITGSVQESKHLPTEYYRYAWEASNIPPRGSGLFVGDNSARALIAASQIVGEDGRVYITNDRMETMENAKEWHEKLGSPESLPDVQPVSLQDSSCQCDAAVICAANPASHLELAIKQVKYEGFIVVLSKRFDFIASCLDHLSCNKHLPLCVYDVTENRDRNWIIKPAQLDDKQKKGNTAIAPFICRPAYKNQQHTVFMLRLRKLSHQRQES